MLGPVIILGMHRSGTSFLVRSLALSGLWLGKDSELETIEGRAYPGNPKGNYESREVASINESILRHSMGAWNKPPKSIMVTQQQQSIMQQFLSSLEAGKPDSYSIWGWKDPRTVLTLGSWQQLLGQEAILVATFRHPQLVAMSLLARNGMSLKEGYALWAHYNRLLLRHLKENPGILLRFDIDPIVLVHQVEQACRYLGLQANTDAIKRWFDRTLVSNTLNADKAPTIFQTVVDVWEDLMTYYEGQSIEINS